MKIKKGDTVFVTSGKAKGKTGPVLRVIKDTDRVMIDGINLYKKFVKSRTPGTPTQQIELPRSINISNVALVCPSCKKPTRIGYKVDGDTKSRVCKKCNAII